MAPEPSISSKKFAEQASASETAAPSALLDLCTEELELKSIVLDGLADGILAHTPDGELVYFNAAAAAIYGYTFEEFADIGRWGWVPPEARTAIPKHVAEILESGEVHFQSLGYTPGTKERIRTEVHARRIVVPGIGDVFVSVIQDVTERMEAHETIKHLAFHDTLTGLANRTMLDEQLGKAIASAERHDETVGVVYLDLDSFKPVNDTFGHAAGDVVLKTIADRLRDVVREYDTVARIGGDEFVVLFPRLTRREDLPDLGRKLEECIDKPIPVGDRTVHVTATVGLAMYEPGEAPDELISRADHAMYRSRSCDFAGCDTLETVD